MQVAFYWCVSDLLLCICERRQVVVVALVARVGRPALHGQQGTGGGHGRRSHSRHDTARAGLRVCRRSRCSRSRRPLRRLQLRLRLHLLLHALTTRRVQADGAALLLQRRGKLGRGQRGGQRLHTQNGYRNPMENGGRRARGTVWKK